jgi:hypothetical protein
MEPMVEIRKNSMPIFLQKVVSGTTNETPIDIGLMISEYENF